MYTEPTGHQRASVQKLPTELILHGVAPHVTSLADLVSLAEVMRPGVERETDIWDAQSYRQLRTARPPTTPLTPPPSYAQAVARGTATRLDQVDVRMAWTWRTGLAALAGPRLAPALRAASSVFPTHPLFAADAARENALRFGMALMADLGTFLAAVYALQDGPFPAPERGWQRALFVDRAYHALAVGEVWSIGPDHVAETARLRAVLDQVDAAADIAHRLGNETVGNEAAKA